MFKQAIFIKHLPYIEEKIEQGYKLSEVVMLLKLEHNFDMKTTSNLSNYLCRFRNKLAAQTEKKIDKANALKPKSLLRKNEINSQSQDDDEVDPKVLEQLKAELEKDKKSMSLLVSKSLFDRS